MKSVFLTDHLWITDAISCCFFIFVVLFFAYHMHGHEIYLRRNVACPIHDTTFILWIVVKYHLTVCSVLVQSTFSTCRLLTSRPYLPVHVHVSLTVSAYFAVASVQDTTFSHRLLLQCQTVILDFKNLPYLLDKVWQLWLPNMFRWMWEIVIQLGHRCWYLFSCCQLRDVLQC